MQSQMLSATVLVCVTLLTLSAVVTNAMSTPPLCSAEFIDEMPHIKKVCIALENSNQLYNALNAYIRNEAAALTYRAEDLQGAPGGTGKRTDVDHVFLRFGRRR